MLRKHMRHFPDLLHGQYDETWSSTHNKLQISCSVSIVQLIFSALLLSCLPLSLCHPHLPPPSPLGFPLLVCLETIYIRGCAVDSRIVVQSGSSLGTDSREKEISPTCPSPSYMKRAACIHREENICESQNFQDTSTIKVCNAFAQKRTLECCESCQKHGLLAQPFSIVVLPWWWASRAPASRTASMIS